MTKARGLFADQEGGFPGEIGGGGGGILASKTERL